MTTSNYVTALEIEHILKADVRELLNKISDNMGLLNDVEGIYVAARFVDIAIERLKAVQEAMLEARPSICDAVESEGGEA